MGGLIKFLFSIFIVGPLILGLLIGWDITHFQNVIDDLSSAPNWVLMLLVIFTIGMFVETVRR